MNRLEEIQGIIKNFIYEKQQMKQKISEIENKRAQLAQERNESKSNIKTQNAFTKEVEAKVSALGKQIAELGNQSQELQNKLDAKFLDVKNEVNIQIDTLISEGIRKIRKVEEVKEELENKIVNQENRNSKYEIQKQEFFARFGRMPELSANAQQENQIQEDECVEYKQKIQEIEKQIESIQEEISELVKNKQEFKNGNWSCVVEQDNNQDCQEEILQNEEVVEKFVEEIHEVEKIEEQQIENIQQIEENIENDMEEDDLNDIVNLVANMLQEQDEIEVIEEANTTSEEESIILPFIEEQEIKEVEKIETANIECAEEIEKVKSEEQYQEIDTTFDVEIEEVRIEEIKPIEELVIEEVEPIPELTIEEFEAIEDVEVGNIEPISNLEIEEISIEKFEEVPEIEVEEFKNEELITETKGLEELLEEQITKEAETQQIEEINQTEEINAIEEAEEIIIKEEKVIKQTPIFNGKVTILNIIAKFEDGEVVYKAELSNGDVLKVYPTRVNSENILLKDKENRDELKEILINYAIAEYRILDKKVIKKIDPIVCEVLVKFAKEYNYDTQNLIYNYAMSFSKNEDIELDAIPQIIYNFSFIGDMGLSKKEKETLMRICKNARKNEKIEIIGYNTGLKKIKYIFRRTFNLNENALPEGKY